MPPATLPLRKFAHSWRLNGFARRDLILPPASLLFSELKKMAVGEFRPRVRQKFSGNIGRIP